MTSDVAGARPLSPGSGEEQPLSGTRGREESGRPINRARGRTCGSRSLARRAFERTRRRESCDELGPDWLVLDVWLARSLLRYAARNLSIENTVPRDSM